MIFNNAELLPTVDNLEENFIVVRIVAPSSGFSGGRTGLIATTDYD